MRTWMLFVLCMSGCEWNASVATRQPNIDNAEILGSKIEGTWVRYESSPHRVGESSPVTIRLEQSSRRYKISWPESKRLTATASAMVIKKDPTYALAELELTDTESTEKVFWLCLIHVKEDRMCIWWISDQKLKSHAKTLNLEIEFESCFPFGTRAECEPKELLKAVLSNPAAVVGDQEIYYRQNAK